jgi:chromosome segregation ATPase
MYVGARYVPKFADPIEWDTERGYESLTIVTYKGESYTSKCPVPPGIDIKNERYWALTGAYNAQVEEYKNQVKDLSEQVTGFASDNKEFRDKITQYDKDNAEMKNTVASTVARVDALAERVDNADAAISDLQAGQAQTVKDIAALEAKDADLQRQITSNDTDISAIQAKDREQDARLSAIETVNDAQAATITQNTQDIARNTTNIQDNAASIAVNSKELAKHAEQLKDHAAQLSVLHKEVTDNHTAIERLTSVTDGLRADLTEDEAKIAQNADAIAHIQQKDVEQDGRLDALEGRATTAEGRLDALDTKTDATNTALTAETNRAKAAEIANGKLIAANAQELARHSDELSDHERRISALETTTDGHTQSIADLKAKDTALDAAIAAVDDKVEHLELIDPKEYAKTIARIDAKDTAQDNRIHALETASNTHVTKTAFEASQKTQDDAITNLNTTKANKSDIPDVSRYATKEYVDNQDATRIPLKTGNYNNTVSSIALGIPTHTPGAPDEWDIYGFFPYPVFSYKNRPSVNVDLTKGNLHLYKADGTELTGANWVTTGNINNAFGVIARLGNNFTPDSPFYVIVYQNDADKYPTASDEPTT